MKVYIIASTPRCGSNWLCAWLRGCGAGNPREYFHRDTWLEEIIAHNPPDIRCVKVFWNHVLRRNNSNPGEFLDSAVRQLSEGQPVEWVYLSRRDKLRQAVSLLRVHNGGGWTQIRTPRQDVSLDYDPITIQLNLRYLNGLALDWLYYFKSRQITPLQVVYEDMCADIEREVKRVLFHIGVGEYQAVDIPLRKQAGQDVERLVTRYRAEVG